MATEILRPQDCLRPNHHFYDPFSPPKPFTNRRRSRSVRTNQASPSPPNPKHGRPNPKSTRKFSSSSSSPSTSPLSSSPPSTSPLSTSPVHEGFRLLKRGEAFRPAQPGSEKKSPVESKQPLVKKHEPSLEASPPTEKVPLLRRSDPPPTRVEKTPPPKKNQSDRTRPDLGTPPPPPPKTFRFGSDKDSCFAGPNFAVRAPEASCLPQPGFLLRSTSVGPASDDEASRALRSLLKLQFL